MKIKDNTFVVEISRFNEGQAPLAHLDSLSEIGNAGNYSVATNVNTILKPGIITQGNGLANLINGTEADVVSELINFIQDKAVAANVAYAIGPTKLFKLSSTTVASGGTPSWPQTITTCLDGSSVIDLKGNLYGFYNMTGGVGDILKMPLSTEVIDPDWGSTIPTGKAALQDAIHPVATKEDTFCFGNGRYLGTYIDTTTTLAPTKLDFGEGNIVADVIFHANQWWIAVNDGVSGTNRTKSQIYLYDGSATSSILSDEIAVGVQRIGFIYPLNGVIFICYQDLSSSGGFKIGYISGRSIKQLVSFTGSLPTFAQKTLFLNTILFLSNSSIYSAGAVIDKLPFAIVQLASGGYTTCGAISAPFGTPMIASTQSTSYKLAQFSGYATACSWKSIIIPTTSGRNIGMIDEVVVFTNVLASGASALLKIESNEAVTTTTIGTITTVGKTRHLFKVPVKDVQNFRIYLDWSGGSTSNPVEIKKIIVLGHYVEK